MVVAIDDIEDLQVFVSESEIRGGYSIGARRRSRAQGVRGFGGRHTGPFGYSRNPVYLSAALLQAALGVLFNNVWILLMIVPALVVIHHVVVLKEEAYLEARFGSAYLE